MILWTGARKNFRIWFLPTSEISSCDISQGKIISLKYRFFFLPFFSQLQSLKAFSGGLIVNSKYGHFSLYFATAVQNRTLFRRDRGSSFQPFILVRRNKGLIRRVGDSAYWTLYTSQMIRDWTYNMFDPVPPFSPLYTDRGWLYDQGVGIQLTRSFLLADG